MTDNLKQAKLCTEAILDYFIEKTFDVNDTDFSPEIRYVLRDLLMQVKFNAAAADYHLRVEKARPKLFLECFCKKS